MFASLLRGASRETYRGVVLIYCQHRVIMKSTFSHWIYIGEIWQRWNNQESTYYQFTLIYLFQGPSFLQYVKNRFSMFKPWVWVSYLIHAPPWNKQFAPRNCLVGRGFISFWNAICCRCKLLVFSWRLIASPKGDFIVDVQVTLWVVREDSSTPETKTWWATATKPFERHSIGPFWGSEKIVAYEIIPNVAG